jgi:hypothetical protein
MLARDFCRSALVFGWICGLGTCLMAADSPKDWRQKREEMPVVKAGTEPSGEAQKAFAQACSGCAAILTELRTAWNIKANPGTTLKRKPVTDPVQAALQEAVAASVKPKGVPENLKPVQAALTEAVASSAATGQRKEALKRKKVTSS